MRRKVTDFWSQKWFWAWYVPHSVPTIQWKGNPPLCGYFTEHFFKYIPSNISDGSSSVSVKPFSGTFQSLIFQSSQP